MIAVETREILGGSHTSLGEPEKPVFINGKPGFIQPDLGVSSKWMFVVAGSFC